MRKVIVPARNPTSSTSSRWAVSSGSSPSTSRMPAGSSTMERSSAGRYWSTSTTDACPSGSKSSGTTATAPGDRTM